MKTVLCILFLGIMVGFVGVQSAQCENMIVNGVEVDEFGVAGQYQLRECYPSTRPNLLSFGPPCLFTGLHCLSSKTAYKHLGFSLKGNGAVVNECGNWTVTGYYSVQIFLALIAVRHSSNGKIPSLPEKFTHLVNQSRAISWYSSGHGRHPGGRTPHHKREQKASQLGRANILYRGYL